MSAIRDYLNLGLHRGFEACINYNDGEWSPSMFKRWSANLSGNVVVTEDGSVIITDYPTTKNTVFSLQCEMYDLVNKLGVELSCKNKCCVISKK